MSTWEWLKSLIESSQEEVGVVVVSFRTAQRLEDEIEDWATALRLLGNVTPGAIVQAAAEPLPDQGQHDREIDIVQINQEHATRMLPP